MTLATPHKGVEEGKLGQLIGNQQVTSLRPFSKQILELSRGWATSSEILPCRYYCGLDDTLVDDFSAFPDNEDHRLFKVEGSHTSICKPELADCALLDNLSCFIRKQLGLGEAQQVSEVVQKPMPNVETVVFTRYDSGCEDYYISRNIDKYVDSILAESHVWLWGDPGLGKTTTIQRAMILKETQSDYIDLSPCPNNSSHQFLLQEILDSLKNKYLGGIGSNTYCGQNRVAEIGSILINLKPNDSRFLVIDEVPSLSEEEFLDFVESIFNLATYYANSGNRTLKFLISTRSNPMKDLTKVAKEKFLSHFSPLKVKSWSEDELRALLSVVTAPLLVDIDEVDVVAAITRCAGSPRVLKNAFKHFVLYGRIDGSKKLEESVTMIVEEGIYDV